MVGIYLILNPMGKAYIGQSWNINKRIGHYRNLKCNGQPHLFNSLKKYGFDSHEIKILHELPEDIKQNILDEYEQFYLDAYHNCGFGMMNIRQAGSRGKLANETRVKLAEKWASNSRRKEELRENMTGKKIWLGKRHSNETRLKQKLSSLGKPKSPEHRLKCIENLKKAIAVNIGSEHSDSTIAKMRQNSIWSKPIIQYDINGRALGEYFSIMQASRISGINDWLIRAVLRGKKESYGGFKWKYKNELGKE